MNNLKEMRQRLERVFEGYAKLKDSEQKMAVSMVFVMLRQMLCGHSHQRQKLEELARKYDRRSHVERERGKLVRKTNASSPTAPIKPVKTTKKNELRRK